MRMHRAAMKRLATIVGLVALVVMLVGGAAVWQRYFRTPQVDLRPLPAGLVALASPSGQRLFGQSGHTADYAPLVANFVSQSRRAYCGVASSVITLNALRGARPRLDQSTFFTPPASEVRHPLQVTVGGMSLAQLGELLEAHGAESRLYPAADTDIETFRTIARQNLATPGDFVLVNYQRAALGQEEMGHISPLAAYDAATDRFLILDVAAHKYPPVWVSTAALWTAMSTTLNRQSKRTRGFVVVREGRGPA
jgi:hypothetical protein